MIKARCPACKRLHLYSKSDWRYISGIPSKKALCSRGCLRNYIVRQDGEYPSEAISPDAARQGNVYSKRFNSWFCSYYEVLVASWLNDNKIEFEYEKLAFLMGERNRQYIPDFYLPQYKVFLEVKGVWEQGAKKKVKEFVMTYPETPLIIVPWTLYNEFKKDGTEERIIT